MGNLDRTILRIRAFAGRRGLSKSRYALKAGLTVNALRGMDSPDWNPTAETLRKLEEIIPGEFEADAFLPYARQSIDDDDVAAVADVLRGDFLTTGPAVKAFEDAVAARVGARFAVCCSSGTAALHLAALASGLGPGDRVVVPAVTFLATANAARFVGSEVVFADVDADSGLLTADSFTAALDQEPDVKAVFPVHLGGQPAPMEDIAAIAQNRGIAVIEDACHALGSTYAASGGDPVEVGACRHSLMAAFSFHPVKTIAMGEGGMVTTNDEAVCGRLMEARNHGMIHDADAFENADLAFEGGAANPWYYEMHRVGFNYRCSDIHAALGLSQMGKLERFVRRRRALVERYDRMLEPMAPLVRPLGRRPGTDPAWHLYVALIDFARAGISRGRLMESLRADGIGTQVHYIPVHQQPYYRRRYGPRTLPGADRYYARALSLPLFPAMSDGDVDRVVGALDRALGDAGAPSAKAEGLTGRARP